MRSTYVNKALVLLVILACTPRAMAAQQPASTSPAPPIDDTIVAGGQDAEAPARTLIKAAEFEGRYFTIRIGGGFLYDYAAYEQNANSKEQFALTAEPKIRDTRVLLNGRLKFIERATTWSAGVMYDYVADKWVFRQTGIMVAVPEIWGDIFVGRSKEGFSLNKVMVGYAGWTLERCTMSDAAIPLLADGVKWLGYLEKPRLLWNLGVFFDEYSEGQSFATYDNQIVGRIAWLPILSEDGEDLMHVGLSLRYGHPDEGLLQLRSRPEVFAAPYFVDTGQFAAAATKMAGLEVYYRPRNWTFGTEYIFQAVESSDTGNPFFHGGEAVMTWLITGETRGYNTRGGYFNFVSPNRPVVQGGPGAWEIVGRGSYIDLDSGTLTGGKFWRLTPMVNWYLTDNVRLEFAYGYGSLNRFGIVGKTQFFQSRLQLQL